MMLSLIPSDVSGTESWDPKHGVDQKINNYMISKQKWFQMDGKNYWIYSNIKFDRVVISLLVTSYGHGSSNSIHTVHLVKLGLAKLSSLRSLKE